MDMGSILKTPEEDGSSALKIAPSRIAESPKYLVEQKEVIARVRKEGAKRIARSCDRAVAMGIIDTEGNLLKKKLPADMLHGSDRDFGG
jgi:hypothetical protein